MTDEIKQRISEGQLNRLENRRKEKGWSFSEEHIKKLRLKAKQQIPHIPSEEEKKKLSNSITHTKNCIFGMYDDNNNLIKVFKSIKDILTFLHLKDGRELRKARKDGNKYHGYYWKDLPKSDLNKYTEYL